MGPWDAIAMSVKAQPIHLAWGSGNATWDTTPQPESIDSAALLSEIGRRAATYVAYCEPDVAGAGSLLCDWFVTPA